MATDQTLFPREIVSLGTVERRREEFALALATSRPLRQGAGDHQPDGIKALSIKMCEPYLIV